MKTKCIILGLLLISFSCTKNEDISEPTVAVELSDTDRELICQEIVKSQDFSVLISELTFFVERLIPDNTGEEIASNTMAPLFSNWDALGTWVAENIEKTKYDNVLEFVDAFESINNIIQSLNRKHQVFFANENNCFYFKKFVDNYAANREQKETVKLQSVTCLSTLNNCVASAERTRDIEACIGAAMTIFVPVAGAALVAAALIDYRNAVNSCFRSYYACSEQ
jgi:hypothetical protein